VIRVSACVISLNEEDRIERCLRSVSFCDELLVLDSGSTDRTREIAESLGARVELQPFLGHSKQKYRAAELARNEWILSLDCDEWLSEELSTELQALIADMPEGYLGASVPRRNIYLGRPMRHGIFWPDRKLRLFDRRKAQWGGTDPHDRVELHQEGDVLSLQGELMHVSYRSFAEHRQTVRGFAAIAAKAMHAKGRRSGALSPWARGLGAFLKGYVMKHGALDGWRGLLAAAMSARYDWIKYRDLRSLQRGAGRSQ
jgi:glycosyltransferase involved in cell wall biosynthesis